MRLFPALAYIRACRLFANRHKTFVMYDFAGLSITLGCRRFDSDPGRFTQHLRIRLVGLFRMSRFGRGFVYQDSHKALNGL